MLAKSRYTSPLGVVREEPLRCVIKEISEGAWETYLGDFIEMTNNYDEIHCGSFNTGTFAEPFIECSWGGLNIRYAKIIKDGNCCQWPLGYRGVIADKKDGILGRIILKELTGHPYKGNDEDLHKFLEKPQSTWDDLDGSIAFFSSHRKKGYFKPVMFLNDMAVLWLEAHQGGQIWYLNYL